MNGGLNALEKFSNLRCVASSILRDESHNRKIGQPGQFTLKNHAALRK
jgi:hypothetical protein